MQLLCPSTTDIRMQQTGRTTPDLHLHLPLAHPLSRLRLGGKNQKKEKSPRFKTHLLMFSSETIPCMYVCSTFICFRLSKIPVRTIPGTKWGQGEDRHPFFLHTAPICGRAQATNTPTTLQPETMSTVPLGRGCSFLPKGRDGCRIGSLALSKEIK